MFENKTNKLEIASFIKHLNGQDSCLEYSYFDIAEKNFLCVFSNRTRPDTRLSQSRVGGQGPYLRSLDHFPQNVRYNIVNPRHLFVSLFFGRRQATIHFTVTVSRLVSQSVSWLVVLCHCPKHFF